MLSFPDFTKSRIAFFCIYTRVAAKFIIIVLKMKFKFQLLLLPNKQIEQLNLKEEVQNEKKEKIKKLE